MTANTQGTQVRQDTYDYSICCPAGVCEFGPDCEAFPGEERIYTFEGSVKMVQPEASLALFFAPPHGDIIFNGVAPEDAIDVLLADEYEHELSFRIYPDSGLVDPSPEPDES